MRSRIVIRVALGLILVVTVGIFAVWLRERPEQPKKMMPMRAVFLGHHQGAAGPQARVSITNPNPVSVPVEMHEPLVKTNGGFLQRSTPTLLAFDLAPNSATNLLIDRPYTADDWRIPISYAPVATPAEQRAQRLTAVRQILSLPFLPRRGTSSLAYRLLLNVDVPGTPLGPPRLNPIMPLVARSESNRTHRTEAASFLEHLVPSKNMTPRDVRRSRQTDAGNVPVISEDD